MNFFRVILEDQWYVEQLVEVLGEIREEKFHIWLELYRLGPINAVYR